MLSTMNYQHDLIFIFIGQEGRRRACYTGIALTIYDEQDEDAQDIKIEKMGIEFKNMDIHDGEWVEIEDRNIRKKRKKTKHEIDLKAKHED